MTKKKITLPHPVKQQKPPAVPIRYKRVIVTSHAGPIPSTSTA